MPRSRTRTLHLVTDDTAAPDLTDAWTLAMRAAGLRERTIGDRIQLVTRVARRTGAPVHALSPAGITMFLAQPMGAGTRQTYYVGLKAWHRWLLQAGHRSDDPMISLPSPRAPRRQPRPITTAHLRKLLNTRMKRRTRALILLCAYQGLRIGEACSVKGEDVDLVGGQIRVVGKGGVDAILPLHPVITQMAATMPQRGWWFPAYGPNQQRPDGAGPILPRSASSIVSAVMERAGVPGTAHCLRHWAATEMLRGGADARVVQTVLRHASLATTASYLAVDSDAQTDALGRLPKLDDTA